MTPEPGSWQATDAETLRAALRRGLTTALKARESDAVAALRTAIAAIDNAEAVAGPDVSVPVTNARIAGARTGVGSTEAVRRQLDGSQLRAILRDQIVEHTREADRYDALGQAEAAQRLRRQAGVLAPYLPPEDADV
jgi:uncharacterized protein YqeY